MNTYEVALAPDDVLCREGERQTDLFLVLAGELLVCVRRGTQVTAVASLGKGQFIGELAFFDNHPRGADVVAMTPCKLLKIPSVEALPHLPAWYVTLGQRMGHKIRTLDDAIRARGLRRRSPRDVAALSIEEQRRLFQILDQS